MIDVKRNTDNTVARSKKRAQAGFTIIELLIATLIFSLVLLLITIGVITFTKVYYKGLNQAKTQTAVRTITENIGQAIQFSGGAVISPIGDGPNGSKGICVSGKRFSYLPGWQLVDVAPDENLKQSRHSLVLDEAGDCATAQDVKANPQGTELLSVGMRLSKLTVEQIGATSSYRVTVRVLFGDNDLIYSPSNNPAGAAAPDATCRLSFTGSQYCASAELSTIVTKRINQTP